MQKKTQNKWSFSLLFSTPTKFDPTFHSTHPTQTKFVSTKFQTTILLFTKTKFSSEPVITFPTEKIIMMQTHRNNPRQVRFNIPANQVVTIDEPATSDIKAAWYSKEDERNIKLQRRSDILSVARAMSSIPSHEITSEELCKTLGLENALSSDLALQMIQRRLRHKNAVLGEQHFQISSFGMLDGDKIRIVSELCSRQSREKACGLALGFFQMEF